MAGTEASLSLDCPDSGSRSAEEMEGKAYSQDLQEEGKVVREDHLEAALIYSQWFVQMSTIGTYVRLACRTVVAAAFDPFCLQQAEAYQNDRRVNYQNHQSMDPAAFAALDYC